MKAMRAIGRSTFTVLVTALILALVATVVYAADIVTNGDFSSLTGSQPDHWTPWSGDTIVADGTGACGAGIATVQGSDIATAEQCIRLTSPGTDWTFSADMAVLDGFASAAAYFFYASSDCTGTALSNGTIGNATTSMMQNFSNSFTYDTATEGANSVLIGIETANFGGTATGCFDNVSFSAAGATDVTLHGTSASRPASPLQIGVLLGLGTIAPLFFALRRKKRSG